MKTKINRLGTDLSAYIGNSSFGNPESVTLKYNMP